MFMKRLILIFLFIVSNKLLFSQSGWNWPDNKSLAEEKNVLYTDYLKQGDCLSALEFHSWLLENVPNLHVSSIALFSILTLANLPRALVLN